MHSRKIIKSRFDTFLYFKNDLKNKTYMYRSILYEKKMRILNLKLKINAEHIKY